MGVFIAMFFFFMFCHIDIIFFLIVSLFLSLCFTSAFHRAFVHILELCPFVSCILLFCCQPWIFSLFTLPFAYDLVDSSDRISH